MIKSSYLSLDSEWVPRTSAVLPPWGARKKASSKERNPESWLNHAWAPAHRIFQYVLLFKLVCPGICITHEVVCHSLFQGATFCQISPPWLLERKVRLWRPFSVAPTWWLSQRQRVGWNNDIEEKPSVPHVANKHEVMAAQHGEIWSL